MFSGDEFYGDDITSGPDTNDGECPDCYPFECRGYRSCDEYDPFTDED